MAGAADAQTLVAKGVVVLKSVLSEKRLAYHRKAILEALSKCSEYKKHEGRFVMSHFGALGHPSASHNLGVRQLRAEIHPRYLELLSHVLQCLQDAPGGGGGEELTKVQQLYDRLSQRQKGDKIGGESFHRDEAKGAASGDIIFGGYINLDKSGSTPQCFSCVRGTQLLPGDPRISKGGFNKITDKSKIAKYKERSKVFKVHPGDAIIFFQNILHEIHPHTVDHNSLRLYTGWRLTAQSTPLNGDEKKAMELQAVPKLPSGQTPGVYEKMHVVCHLAKLKKWAVEMFEDVCLETERHTTTNDKQGYKIGEEYKIPKKPLPPLTSGAPLRPYPPYAPWEIELMLPGTSFSVPTDTAVLDKLFAAAAEHGTSPMIDDDGKEGKKQSSAVVVLRLPSKSNKSGAMEVGGNNSSSSSSSSSNNEDPRAPATKRKRVEQDEDDDDNKDKKKESKLRRTSR